MVYSSWRARRHLPGDQEMKTISHRTILGLILSAIAFSAIVKSGEYLLCENSPASDDSPPLGQLCDQFTKLGDLIGEVFLFSQTPRHNSFLDSQDQGNNYFI
ncbi:MULTISPECIES: hypothetical protein [Limnospira]|nr:MULTISPECIES: hypothetical protein [unclassified Limnospira]MDT9186511.1 hypothetical protein [Limnospira sp. PMC 894.15]MDT9196594.1 hypothetical protein [Limnospira sp. PMC 1042.18]MDT9273166.1 hypothetical protein [Limnospira sp. PMC 737.11]